MDWNEWFYETISWKGDTYVPRWRVLRHFVKDGLIPFLEKNGYSVAGTPYRELVSRIATGLYENRNRSCVESRWNFMLVNVDYSEGDEAHWYHIMNQEKWDAFWDTWGQWTDVSLDTWRGDDRRIDIQAYCWTQINLENSFQTRVVNEHMGFTDDMNHMEDRHLEDSYLREAAESGEWGGYRK
jgi:hypothetical protein